jgi:hypothetical protein
MGGTYEKVHGDHVIVRQQDRRISVALCYPDVEQNINAVEIELVDVRAADSILVSYDKGRDGWSIKQASKFEWEPGDEVCDPDWQEVAFIQAWARQPPDWTDRAIEAIERGDNICLELARAHGVQLDSVRQSSWFIEQVAKRLKRDAERATLP